MTLKCLEQLTFANSLWMSEKNIFQEIAFISKDGAIIEMLILESLESIILFQKTAK